VPADKFGTSGGFSQEVVLPMWTTTGNHVVHATYSGDNFFDGSVSPDLTILVTPGTPRRRTGVRRRTDESRQIYA
jgi:hypothetical protein